MKLSSLFTGFILAFRKGIVNARERRHVQCKAHLHFERNVERIRLINLNFALEKNVNDSCFILLKGTDQCDINFAPSSVRMSSALPHGFTMCDCALLMMN